MWAVCRLLGKGKGKGKWSIAVHNTLHRYGNSHAIQCYLPPGRGDIPARIPKSNKLEVTASLSVMLPAKHHVHTDG